MRRCVVQIVIVTGVIGGAWGSRAMAQAPAVPTSSSSPWTLDAALSAALSQHPLVEAARAEVAAAQGSRQTAGLWPNLVATYWVENARFPGQATSSVLERETSAYATLPLEPFLQRGSRVARADADVQAATADVTAAERRVAADVVHAFHRMFLAQVSLDVTTENQAAIGQLVEYLRSRVSQGATPEAELIRAQVEQDRAEVEAALAQVEVLRAAAAIRPFLGDRGSVDALHVAAPDWTSFAPLPPVGDLAAHALAARPELLASRAKVQAASAAIDVERSLVIRQLGASFGAKRTLGVNAMVAGVSLTVPLFDRNQGEIRRATGERIAAEQQTRWLERAVASEVEAEYEAVTLLVPRVTALRPSLVRRAEESRRIAVAAYQEGAASLLQVLDAAHALSEARLTFARASAAAGESAFSLGVAAGYDARAAARFAHGDALRSSDLRSNEGAR